MNYQLPQLLPECEVSAQQFCDTCRRKEHGRSFREAILRIRGVDSVDVDFECPKGKPWRSRGLGDTVAKLTSKMGIKPCGGCKKRQGKMNKLVPYKKA